MASYPMQYTYPPRRVPLSLRVVNFFNAGAQVGWAVFGFGMIFFWAFTWNADYSFVNFRGSHSKVLGRVTGVEDTRASENKQHIHAHHYEYSVLGVPYEGTSWTKEGQLSPGSVVDVEYDEGDPKRSRIAGMRRGMFSPGVLFVVIFPAIGLALLIVFTRIGTKRNELLRDGVFTTGVLKSRRPTNMTVNKRPVFELIFEFKTRDGRKCEATARTTDPSRLEDEAQEPLLYDPENPSKAYVLDEAPARPKVEMNGDLVGRPEVALAALILPALVTLAHGLVAYLKFR
jgi:hypothetical protein